ncbi:MAG: RNA polymerase sigma factor [Acutalibacteraceae bacterium]
MDEFEKLFCECRGAVERFVRFKISSKFDADDVLGEVYMTASEKYGTLKNKSAFRAWIIGIARYKCNDYYRRRVKAAAEVPIDEVSETLLTLGRMGIVEAESENDFYEVHETLEKLTDKDKDILYMYFFLELPQAEIAKKLNIPLGTVKSRLFTAKRRFKEKYPYHPKPKGEKTIMKLPKILPEYTITKSDKEPFSVVWEELMGWFLVPRLGEKLSWGLYDMPDRALSTSYDLSVTGKAFVHGIEGVSIDVKQDMHKPKTDGDSNYDMRFIAQLTDTHCRFLAESHYDKNRGAMLCFTFLDGDEIFESVGSFMSNWGFGENNCGNETHISAKSDILRNGNDVKCDDKPFLIDIVGRYTVTIGGKEYDTVCVMDIGTYNRGVVSEQYLDKNGRTILWRRFNRDDWAFDRYKQKWSEKLPNNERIYVNGETYVHWYDCITDYIM